MSCYSDCRTTFMRTRQILRVLYIPLQLPYSSAHRRPVSARHRRAQRSGRPAACMDSSSAAVRPWNFCPCFRAQWTSEMALPAARSAITSPTLAAAACRQNTGDDPLASLSLSQLVGAQRLSRMSR